MNCSLRARTGLRSTLPNDPRAVRRERAICRHLPEGYAPHGVTLLVAMLMLTATPQAIRAVSKRHAPRPRQWGSHARANQVPPRPLRLGDLDEQAPRGRVLMPVVGVVPCPSLVRKNRPSRLRPRSLAG